MTPSLGKNTELARRDNMRKRNLHHASTFTRRLGLANIYKPTLITAKHVRLLGVTAEIRVYWCIQLEGWRTARSAVYRKVLEENALLALGRIVAGVAAEKR